MITPDDTLFRLADEVCERLLDARSLAGQFKEIGRGRAQGRYLDPVDVEVARKLLHELTEKLEEVKAAAQAARNEL